MSCSRLGELAGRAAGAWRSCWSRNCDSVIARAYIPCAWRVRAPRQSVRQPGDVLVLTVAGRPSPVAERRERARHERRRSSRTMRCACRRPRACSSRKRELVLERLPDRLARRSGGRPHSSRLKQAERLLAGLVEELLVGVAALALVGRGGAQLARRSSRLRSAGNARVVVAACSGTRWRGGSRTRRAWEAVEQLGRQASRRRAAPRRAMPYCLARSARAALSSASKSILTWAIEPSGQRHAAVAGAGLDRDLADPGGPGRPLRRAPSRYDLHERVQLLRASSSCRPPRRSRRPPTR